MTSGEVTGDIRAYLIRLLSTTEVDASLGSGEERKENLDPLQRYRSDLVRWCRFAVGAVSPAATSHVWSRRASPIADFLHHIDKLIGNLPRNLPPLTELLEVQHPSALMRDWQGAARSAAMSELVIPRAVARARGDEERRVILKDAVDVFCGIARLDDRYTLEKSWRALALKGPVVGRAIEMSRDLAAAPRDHWIDLVSDARNQAIEGPLLPGIAGAVQAQHNVEHYLRRPTSAFALRDVMRTHAVISLRAAVLAQEHAPELAGHFGERARLYVELVSSRPPRGLAGTWVVASRPRPRVRWPPTSSLAQLAFRPPTPTVLVDLARQCHRVDARVAANIETGFRKDRYLIAAEDLAIAQLPDNKGIRRAGEVWRPVPHGEIPELLRLARERFAAARPAIAPRRSDLSREAYARATERGPSVPLQR